MIIAAAIYLASLVALCITESLWCLLLGGLALACCLWLAAARAQAEHDAGDDDAEYFGGSFRGHEGASDE